MADRAEKRKESFVPVEASQKLLAPAEGTPDSCRLPGCVRIVRDQVVCDRIGPQIVLQDSPQGQSSSVKSQRDSPFAQAPTGCHFMARALFDILLDQQQACLRRQERQGLI